MGSQSENKLPDNCAGCPVPCWKTTSGLSTGRWQTLAKHPRGAKTLLFFFFFKNEKGGGPTLYRRSHNLNTFILGISVPCSIMSRGFSHSCKWKLMMFDLALSKSAGSPFCTDTQNYRHFVQKDAQNYNFDVLRVHFVEFYYIQHTNTHLLDKHNKNKTMKYNFASCFVWV